jgi:hypothetical protein
MITQPSSPASLAATPDTPAVTDVPPALFSSGQVLTATFLSGPFGGIFLLALNRKRLGHEAEAGSIMVVGTVTLFLVLFVAYHLPENSLAGLFFFAQLFVMQRWYNHEQQELYDRALSNGGSRASWWGVIGFSGLALLATYVAAFLLAITLLS